MHRSFERGGLALLVFAVSCAKANGEHARRGAAMMADPPGVRVGDQVVIESATATFVEGVVSALERERAKIDVLPVGKVVEHPLSDVYVPGRPSKGALTAGSFAVCHMPDGRWRGCRIDAFDGDRVRVMGDDALAVEVGREDLLAPTPVTELNVRQRFDRAAKRRAFREGAKSAVRPRVPDGWRPRVGEKVVARRDGLWMGAQLKELARTSARILWDDDRRVVSWNLADIAPQPPVEFPPTVGSYVLAHPVAGPRPWTVMRVESAGELTLVVADEGGDTWQLAPRDVLPMDRGTGGH
jgi:hypothetical protein